VGGYGSGRKLGANCTVDYLWIDARQWQREGRLADGAIFNTSWLRAGKNIGNIDVKIGNGQVILSYSCSQKGGAWERLEYPIPLETTACHYGGVRYWFTCPALGCGRRVAKLYLGDKYFACRHCYQLAYKCQRETSIDRADRKANTIRDKLKWDRGVLSLPGDKPKGMHWKTYARLVKEHNKNADQVILAFVKKMGIMK
jgi:hypothetical protein